MSRNCGRTALLLTLMAAGVLAVPRVSQADDAPVSESPQRAGSGAWANARQKVIDAERPPLIADTPSYSPPYGTELAGAYLATAALGVGLPLLYGAIDPQPGGGGLLLSFALACTPVPLVHLFNDRPGRALGTFFLVPALFLAGGFVGMLTAFVIIDNTITFDTPGEQEDGALSHGSEIFAGGVIGGVLAVGTWAVFDVLNAQRAPRRSSAQLRFGVTPRPGGAAAVLAGWF